MARTYARINVAIWIDDNQFLSLDPLSKLTYLFLLSQSKLTLAGCIDIRETRWASRLGCTVDQLQGSLDDLEDRGYVAQDDGTGELVIVSFTRHDTTTNPKVVAGVWSAWRSIESANLRRIVATNMPESYYDDRFRPPTTRPEPVDNTPTAVDNPVDRFPIDSQSITNPFPNRSPIDSPLPTTTTVTATGNHQPEPIGNPANPDDAQPSTPTRPSGGGNRKQRVEQALDHLASDELLAEELAGRTFTRGPDVYRQAIRRRLAREASADLHAIARRHPDDEPHQLADRYTGHHQLATLDDLAPTNAAPRERPTTDTPTTHADCPNCDGYGWVHHDDGVTRCTTTQARQTIRTRKDPAA